MVAGASMVAPFRSYPRVAAPWQIVHFLKIIVSRLKQVFSGIFNQLERGGASPSCEEVGSVVRSFLCFPLGKGWGDTAKRTWA